MGSHASTPCSTFLNAVPKALTSKQIKYIESSWAGDKKDRPTVLTTLVENEGYIKVERKKRLSWSSNHYVFAPEASQGSPMFLYTALSSYIHQAMGLHMSGNRTVYVPNPENYNKKIKTFNKFLERKHPEVEPIQFRFYWQKNIEDKSYLKRVSQGKVPISDHLNTTTIHDISYHYSAILLPNEILIYLQQRIALLDLLKEKFRKQFKDVKVADMWLNELKAYLETKTDSLLSFGNITISRDTPESIQEELEKAFVNQDYLPQHIQRKGVLKKIRRTPLDDFKIVFDFYINRLENELNGITHGSFSYHALEAHKKGSFMHHTLTAHEKYPAQKAKKIAEKVFAELKAIDADWNKPQFMFRSDITKLAENFFARKKELSIGAFYFLKSLEKEK